MNRRLIILRHAHSSRDDLDLDDHDRPLDEIGLRDSPIVAREIIQRGWKPDHIFVSSSLRTLQTLENMGPSFQRYQNPSKENYTKLPFRPCYLWRIKSTRGALK